MPLGFWASPKKDTDTKLRLFSVNSSNRKTNLDALETNVNEWLAEHPDIVIEHTNDISQPNANWLHLALAVWYTEK